MKNKLKLRALIVAIFLDKENDAPIEKKQTKKKQTKSKKPKKAKKVSKK